MTDTPNDQPKKKLIIDEDWKTQAQAEKEELERRKHQQETAAQASEAEPDLPLPPPSLELLASSLGIQATVALGLIPNPVTKKPEVRLHQAKHLIDTIALLEEKTAGNRTPEETAALERLLHELRMGYIAVQKRQAKGS